MSKSTGKSLHQLIDADEVKLAIGEAISKAAACNINEVLENLDIAAESHERNVRNIKGTKYESEVINSENKILKDGIGRIFKMFKDRNCKCSK